MAFVSCLIGSSRYILSRIVVKAGTTRTACILHIPVRAPFKAIPGSYPPRPPAHHPRDGAGHSEFVHVVSRQPIHGRHFQPILEDLDDEHGHQHGH